MQQIGQLTETLFQMDVSPAAPWLYGVNPGVYLFSGEAECAGDILNTAKEAALSENRDSLRLLAKKVYGAACFPGMRTVLDCPEGRWLEMPLTPECPLLPLKMHPAYRYGEMTPWGGEQLRRVFDKTIPDERTGEALEVSVIPGLESKADNGQTLGSLIAWEKRLTGLPEGEDFPLLLKLLAAKSSLSVQVHPDDAYAAVHEGKLGKTEAWVILEAEENASILYGMKDGVTLSQLEEELYAQKDIEPLIARMMVKPGDVFYMPAGMVHAIGGGILLYEIQQSSDVTYRLWDFNRTNDKGEKRPLHIRQSLDVILPELKGQRAEMPESLNNQLVPLLEVSAFTLYSANVNGELTLKIHPRFRLLTALNPLKLCWKDAELDIAAGETVFIPADAPLLTLSGKGRALLAF